jgi:hypothetical protein
MATVDSFNQGALKGARGVRWLYARGGELERDFPYGVARQLLERAALAGGDEMLAGAAALARAPLGLLSDLIGQDRSGAGRRCPGILAMCRVQDGTG